MSVEMCFSLHVHAIGHTCSALYTHLPCCKFIYANAQRWILRTAGNRWCFLRV